MHHLIKYPLQIILDVVPYFQDIFTPDDLDECQSSDLNKCHKKAKCIKTPGSYKCTCLDGYFGNGTHCQG